MKHIVERKNQFGESEMKTTEEKVKKVLTKISGVRHIEPTASLTADLGLDSLRMTDLVLHLEDAFGIEFRQSDMNFFQAERRCRCCNPGRGVYRHAGLRRKSYALGVSETAYAAASGSQD